MSPRAGLSPDAVVDAAIGVLDEVGLSGLTLATVAARAGVAPPSLYKHVDGLPAVRRLIWLRVLGEMTELLRSATVGRSGDTALRTLAGAWRDYVRRYPHRVAFLEPAPNPDDPDEMAASTRLTEVVFAVISGYGLEGPDLVHATRSIRAAVHGFCVLEAAGGFGLPESVDESFDVLIEMVIRGTAALAAEAGAEPSQGPSPAQSAAAAVPGWGRS